MGFIVRLSTATKIALVAALCIAQVNGLATTTGGTATSFKGEGSNLASSSVGASNSVAYTPGQSASGFGTSNQASATNKGAATGADLTISGAEASKRFTAGAGGGQALGTVVGSGGAITQGGSGASTTQGFGISGTSQGATQGSVIYQGEGKAAGSSVGVAGNAFGKGTVDGSTVTDRATDAYGYATTGFAPVSGSANIAVLGGLLPTEDNTAINLVGAQSSLSAKGKDASASTVQSGSAQNLVTGPDGQYTTGQFSAGQATSVTVDGKGKVGTNGIAGGLIGNSGPEGVYSIGLGIGENDGKAKHDGLANTKSVSDVSASGTSVTSRGTSAFDGTAASALVNQGTKASSTTQTAVGGSAYAQKNPTSEQAVVEAQNGMTSKTSGQNLYQSGATQNDIGITYQGADGKYYKSGSALNYGAVAGGEAAIAGQVANDKGKATLSGEIESTSKASANSKAADVASKSSGKSTATLPGAVYGDYSNKAAAGGSGSSYGATTNGKTSAGAVGSAIGGAVGSSQQFPAGYKLVNHNTGGPIVTNTGLTFD